MILDLYYFFIFDIGMNQKDVKKTADIWKNWGKGKFYKQGECQG